MKPSELNETALVKYESNDEQVELSPEIVRKYLVSGQGHVSDKEIMMYLNLCRYQKLNPFLREVYLIKYTDSLPASIVTGKETFLKRAKRNNHYQGHKTGISADGKVAWAEVYHEGYKVPIRCEVDYDEYVGLKNNGMPNRMWASKPRTMLKKVALVQSLRECFPTDLGGLYSQEEIPSVNIDDLATEHITISKKEREALVEKKIQQLKNKKVELENSPENPKSIPEKPKTSTTKNFKFLQEVKKFKDMLGEEQYYSVLGSCGYEHSNEVKDRQEQIKIWEMLKELADITINKNTQTADEKEA